MRKNTINHPAFSRNYGFWNEAEQDALINSTVAIAGVGGDGFQLGYKLAMKGVGEIRVADPEAFEPENSNRVLAATTPNVGRNKAEVFKEMVEALPASPKVTIYDDGVISENVEEFLYGADLYLDESELLKPEIGTLLARTALKQETPGLLVMNIGFAGIATSLRGGDFEKIMGIPKDMPLDEVAEMKVDLSRCVPYIPPYGDYRTLLATQGGAPLPTISEGVDMASGLGSTEAFLHLTYGIGNNRKEPTWAPRYRFMDAYTNKSGVIRYPRASYYLGATAAFARTKLGLNPEADYQDDARKRRTDAHSRSA
ncbi:TPA: hypothetical protein DDX46_03240 [Candidatus Saccharibacteria bacterium]|nr:MAG: UBA/THIF-type NAD/FAD binding protein [Candidatus Saccharibacteria bacterium GW2011_GWC2_44_17]OGL33892.1 MAG: hypothetical protein A3E20_04080 [Candidatus Saccharibacteria bacterium RIFCSPHIGHO2_12_FULL_47_16]HBH77737.1 hypothetical protein [Candidatus Saccharibacteria bacterium]